jgi:ABC-type antimicrobial peptide transport system permease subunit
MKTQNEEINVNNTEENNNEPKQKINGNIFKNLLTIISICLNIIVIVAMVVIITNSQNKISTVEDSVTAFKNSTQTELDKISTVETKVNDLNTKVEDADKRITDIAVKNIELDFNIKKYEKATFDLSNATGYSRIDSNGGIFFIIVENVEKYLDGYKINLRIGNPQNCTYNGFELEAEWNKPFTVEMDYDEWTKNKKEKVINMTQQLSSGNWATCSVNLSPMTEEEIHNVSFSISTDSISLYK